MLLSLPNEILHKISTYLKNTDFARFRLSCKQLYDLESLAEIQIRRYGHSWVLLSAHGCIQALEFLHFDVHILRAQSYRPLLYSIKNGELDCIKYMVGLGMTLHDIKSSETVIYCSMYGQLECMKYFISLGLTLDDIRVKSNKALRHVVIGGYLEFVKYLIRMGLNKNDICDYHCELISSCVNKKRLDIFKYLVHPTDENEQPLNWGLKMEDVRGMVLPLFIEPGNDEKRNFINMLITLDRNLDNIITEHPWVLTKCESRGWSDIIDCFYYLGMQVP
jgi:hypothetical protein